MSRSTPAEKAIREQIARDGRITFAQFMEMALYTAPGCYYGSARGKIGARGDYFTSPEVHPAFGALIARQVEQVWAAMGRPAAFDLVEMGAGTGALARDVLTYTGRWAPDFHRALRYTLVERSDAQIRLQQRTLGELGPLAERVVWHHGSALDIPSGSVEGCVLSNELLDALPVHRVRIEGGELKELYVEIHQDQFVEIPDVPSDPALPAYFERLGFLPPDGCLTEVNLAALEWMVRVADALRRGAVITIDYGYPARELYSRRHCDGSLLCFYHHTLNSDPFARIGQQDITTHVDFTSLASAGESKGLQQLGLTTQRSFLAALGIGCYLEQLPRMGLRRRDLEANEAGMRELLQRDGLGRIRVLLQQKGLAGFDPAGLRPEGLRPADLGRDIPVETPPVLTRDHLNLTEVLAGDLLLDAEGMWEELMGEGDG